MGALIILFIVGLLIVFEGLFILIYPKMSAKLMKEISKNLTKLRSIGIVEIIVGLTLVLVSIF